MLKGLELDFGIVIKIEFGAGSVVVIDNVDVGIEVEGKKKIIIWDLKESSTIKNWVNTMILQHLMI